MTAKGSKANNDTGQHKQIKGDGKDKTADTKVKLVLQQHREQSDREPYKPTDPSKG